MGYNIPGGPTYPPFVRGLIEDRIAEMEAQPVIFNSVSSNRRYIAPHATATDVAANQSRQLRRRKKKAKR